MLIAIAIIIGSVIIGVFQIYGAVRYARILHEVEDRREKYYDRIRAEDLARQALTSAYQDVER